MSAARRYKRAHVCVAESSSADGFLRSPSPLSQPPAGTQPASITVTGVTCHRLSLCLPSNQLPRRGDGIISRCCETLQGLACLWGAKWHLPPSPPPPRLLLASAGAGGSCQAALPGPATAQGARGLLLHAARSLAPMEPALGLQFGGNVTAPLPKETLPAGASLPAGSVAADMAEALAPTRLVSGMHGLM